MQALLDVTPVDVPKSLIEMETQALQEQMRQNFAARGMPVKDDMPMPAEIFTAQAQRRVHELDARVDLVLVDRHALHVDPERDLLRVGVREDAAQVTQRLRLAPPLPLPARLLVDEDIAAILDRPVELVAIEFDHQIGRAHV